MLAYSKKCQISGVVKCMSNSEVETLIKIGELAEKRPKQPDLVLFIGRSGGELIDNAKHCYLESVRGKYKFKTIFYTNSPAAATELTANGVPFNSELDMDLITQAALVVCDDFHWRSGVLEFMTKGAKLFQLWHGIPLKSIGLIQAATEHKNMPPDRKRWLEFGYSGYDAVLSTSPYVSEEIFSRAFGAKEFVDFGYPRNDVLLRPSLKLDKLDMINVPKNLLTRLQAHRKAGGKVVVYMPTFRDYKGDGTLAAGHYLDLRSLSEFGKRTNTLFMLKFHPYVKDIPVNLPENCIFCPPAADVYPLLRFTDMLLTDYSSIYFDYLLLNRPIHFHIPDKEEYEEKDRKFMLNFDDWTPGRKSRAQEECFAALEEILANGGDDGFAGERLRMRDILFKYQDDQAAVRCCEFVERLLGI